MRFLEWHLIANLVHGTVLLDWTETPSTRTEIGELKNKMSVQLGLIVAMLLLGIILLIMDCQDLYKRYFTVQPPSVPPVSSSSHPAQDPPPGALP